MCKLDGIENNGEQLYMQYRNAKGETVVCLVNKLTNNRFFYDVKSNRTLSKQEAESYIIDLTGRFLIHPTSVEC